MIGFIQGKAAAGIFEGLYLYEIVLLILGIVFFIVLLLLLFIYVRGKRSIKTLALFFVFPIVMIGYPSIQSIEFGDGIGKIEKAADELERDPRNSGKRTELKNQIKELGDRPVSNPQTLITLSHAHYLTKDTATAKEYADSAYKLDPNSMVVKNFRNRIINP